MRRSVWSVALVLLAAISLVMLAGRDAQAKFYFGKGESIHFLQDVSVKGPNGEALYLGYMTTRHSFLLPYSVSDSGYVLGIKGQSDKYFKLPPERIALAQQSGLLPKPLPPYRLSNADFLIGHSLWIALPLIVLLGFWGRSRQAATREAYSA